MKIIYLLVKVVCFVLFVLYVTLRSPRLSGLFSDTSVLFKEGPLSSTIYFGVGADNVF